MKTRIQTKARFSLFISLLLAAGGVASAAVPGSVVAWGGSSFGQTNVPASLTNAVAVAVGQYHSMAVTRDGLVWAWGGDGSDYQEVNQVPPGLNNVVAIAAGDALSLALKGNGVPVAWGYNGGDGTTNVPAGVTNAVTVAAGGYHGLAVLQNGSVVGWGQSGEGQTTPPTNLFNAVAVAAGGHHSLALRADGTVVGFGFNGYGQATPPAGLSNVVALSACDTRSVALRANGTVVQWGSYSSNTPPAGLSNVVAIATGLRHTLALRNDGSVVSWGEPGWTTLPTGLSNITAIAANRDASLAIVGSGKPVMTVQPWSQTVSTGSTVRLTGLASGRALLRYQWFFNGTPLTNGTAPTLQLNNVQTGQAGSYWLRVSNTFGVVTSTPALLQVQQPSSPPVQVSLIPTGAVWKYLDTGVDAGFSWRGTPYDDSAWPSGPAQLGFGDGDEMTAINSGSPSNRYITAYFRRSFILSNATSVTNLSARLLYDDGAVIYVNGVEAARAAMPTGAINYATLATSTTENAVGVFALDPALLVNGNNVVAVEVHQNTVTSSDLSFDLELTARFGTGPVYPSLAEALDNAGDWTGDFVGQTGVTHDGVDAAQARIECCEFTSSLTRHVTGPAQLRFWWKINAGPGFGALSLWIPELGLNREIRGTNDWQEEIVDLPSGDLTLSWYAYFEDTSPGGPNGAWLDQVRLLPPALPVPVVVTIQPGAGPTNTTVVITGTNFSTNAGMNLVRFGAVRAAVSAASPTALTVQVPQGATYAPVSVTVGGLTAWSPRPFVVTFPNGGAIESASFTPRLDLPAGDGPDHVLVADLDGDGRPDLAVANAFSSTISVYRNLGGSNWFAAPFSLSCGLNPYGLVAADVDGDGRLDLVTANVGANTASVLRNLSAPGGLTPASFDAKIDYPVGSVPDFVAVQDLDGDGRAEIVTAEQGDNSISILPNRAVPGALNAGSFGPRVSFLAGAVTHSVAIGDLDGDGRADVVAGNYGNHTLSVFRNLGVPGEVSSGSFAPAVTLNASGKTVAIGDWDGDGKLDLISGSWQDNTLSFLRNTSAPGVLTSNSFAASVELASGGYTHTVALGDLNGDGKPDLATVSEMPSQLRLYQNTSTPGSLTGASIAPPVGLGTGWNAVGVAIGDLDGDGRPEVVFANHYDDTITIYRNTSSAGGGGSFVRREIARPTVRLITTPPGSVSVHAVEDRPPAGWAVANISHGGVFDAQTGKVKFGPFFDATPRTLSYDVVPPTGAQGVFAFAGSASADGVNSPITGDQTMLLAGPHPAELGGAAAPNWNLTMGEVTAYASAWRRGLPWPVEPQAIPIDYVTRASTLWRDGECYTVAGGATNAPLWWVNCPSSTHAAGAAAPKSAPALTATRQAPSNFVAGESLVMSISVSAASGQTYAVEDGAPAGWSISAISDGGEFDAANGKVKWGPFFDQAPRALSYLATPPAGAGNVASFDGRASIDGTTAVITGNPLLRASARLRVASDDGQLVFSVGGATGQRYTVETSTDLVTWTFLTEVTNTTGRIEFSDPGRSSHPHRFYRTQIVE
jgi:alpha-tubulin suppressor-like RCC1 family protein